MIRKYFNFRTISIPGALIPAISFLFIGSHAAAAKTFFVQELKSQNEVVLDDTSSDRSHDAKTTAAEPTEIIGKIVIQPKPLGASVFPTHRLDIGAIECGKNYLLKIRLVNESKEQLSFRRVGANCSCVNLRVPKGEVPPDETLDVGVEISVPEKLDSPVFLVGVDFYSDKIGRDSSPFMQVRVESKKVKGLVCFGSVPGTLQVGKGLKRLSLPLLVTEPVDPKTLEIETSDTLQDAVVTIATDGEREELIIDIAGVLLDEGYKDCWIKVNDTSSKRSATARFMLEKSPLVSVSPKIITFTKDREKGSWKAKAFLIHDMASINKKGDAKDLPTISTEPNLVAKAHIAGNAIEVTCTKLSQDLYRVELSLPDGYVGKSSEGEINWSIEYGSIQQKFNSLWRISE